MVGFDWVLNVFLMCFHEDKNFVFMIYFCSCFFYILHISYSTSIMVVVKIWCFCTLHTGIDTSLYLWSVFYLDLFWFHFKFYSSLHIYYPALSRELKRIIPIDFVDKLVLLNLCHGLLFVLQFKRVYLILLLLISSILFSLFY